ncbi:hypothetical protein DQD41_21690, partial [Salmonella enterica subsp. enterica]|nr:hypothetical protein [Salmonella enterica subsp. enterica serovar Kouka]
TFPTKIIHYSQRPEAPSVKKTIWHEIHTPALIDVRWGRTLRTGVALICLRGRFLCRFRSSRQ